MPLLNMTICMTCNGKGQIYAGFLNGKEKFRTCPRCNGAGEHEKITKLKTTIRDSRRTDQILKAFCPKCTKETKVNKYYMSKENTKFKCQCGCIWIMKIKDTF